MRRSHRRLTPAARAALAHFTPTPGPAPRPALCAPAAHAWTFTDRVQLSLVDVTLGGYAVAVYLYCPLCSASVEFLGICDTARGRTTLNNSTLLGPDGTEWALELPARRVLLVPQNAPA